MTAWIPNVVPDEPIESAWGNLIRDRTITPFANVAARTAGIAAPAEGMVTYLLDTGALETYYGATVGWKPPWNTAWGVLAYTQITADQPSITSTVPLTGFTATVTVPAGRRIRLESKVMIAANTSNSQWIFYFVEGTALAAFYGNAPAVNNAGQAKTYVHTLTPAAGAHTYTASLGITGGGVSQAAAAYPASFQVIDVGPAANPL